MLKRYRNGVIPAASAELQSAADEAVRKVETDLRANELQAALTDTWALVNRANQYVDQTAPFKLAKDPAQAARLDEVLYNLCEVCRVLAVLLSPFLPQTSARIYEQLGLGALPQQFSAAAWGGLNVGHAIGEPAPLFPRKDDKAKK
jgi:methionyl-tRNA synthetase